jgi:hypothetical protein
MKAKLYLLSVAMAIVMTACASANYKPHPGSVNVFDSQTYDTLITTHAVIDSAKSELASGVFTPKVAAAVKAAVNDLVTSYNVADTAYTAYHTAAVAGGVTPAQTTAVTTALANVNAATAALAAAKVAQ